MAKPKSETVPETPETPQEPTETPAIPAGFRLTRNGNLRND